MEKELHENVLKLWNEGYWPSYIEMHTGANTRKMFEILHAHEQGKKCPCGLEIVTKL